MAYDEKTLIGALASHDSRIKNEALAKVLTQAVIRDRTRKRLQNFRFVFTGGTYERLFEGLPVKGQDEDEVDHRLDPDTADFLHEQCGIIRLRGARAGGVTVLASLVTQRKLSVLWPFFSPLTTHVLFPENLALLRLADQWRAKKLMNSGSALEWLECEADWDRNLNLQRKGLEVEFPSGVVLKAKIPGDDDDAKRRGIYGFLKEGDAKKESELPCDPERLSVKTLEKTSVALISHDEMKSRMLDFVIDYENELVKFKSILATGTTGKLIEEASPPLARTGKVRRYHSGPKGGDIEIATEILYNGCQVVIFFVDPLSAHPHTEDIRVVFNACMVQDRVRMLSNEFQARAWMDRRVRGV